MPIRYLPNDPTTSFPARVVEKRPPRGAGKVGFSLPPAPPERIYPEVDADFTYWQAREAALYALSVWDSVGVTLGRWQNGARQLPLRPESGVGLQAFYDRTALGFNTWSAGQTFFLAASADAVIHEVGHALLDAVRPDLWNSVYPEIVAFHEAFADCLCLFACLLDDQQRAHLLATSVNPATALDQSNGASRIAESIAVTYGESFSPSDPSATARDAFNTLRWTFAHTLPSLVSGGDLSSEPHSFSRIFTGCIYDCIRNIYAGGPATSDGLGEAATTTAELLVEATCNAPEGIEFFRRVGQAMVLADRDRHGGNHQHAIGMAFAAHGITLGSSSLITPTMALSGGARSNGAVGLTATARRDLTRRLNIGEDVRVSYRRVQLGGQRMVDAQCYRSLDLGQFNRQLKNVSVRIADSVLYDIDGSTPRLMDALPRQSVCEEHAAALATAVMDNNLLMENRKIKGRGRASGGKRRETELHALPAFSIRKRRGKATLMRVRCVCQTRPGH